MFGQVCGLVVTGLLSLATEVACSVSVGNQAMFATELSGTAAVIELTSGMSLMGTTGTGNMDPMGTGAALTIERSGSPQPVSRIVEIIGGHFTVSGGGGSQTGCYGGGRCMFQCFSVGFSSVATFRNFILTDCQSSIQGAGIGIGQASLVTLIDSRITFSGTLSMGGAIYASADSLIELERSELSNCWASMGGGLGLNEASLAVKTSKVWKNTASIIGGGVYAMNTNYVYPTILVVSSSNVTQNTAGTDGGGLYLSAGANATIEDTVVASNSGTRGAGLFIDGSSHASLSRCTIELNSATYIGGGFYVDGSETVLALATCSTTRNRVTGAAQLFDSGSGAGFFIAGGTVKQTDCRVEANIASGRFFSAPDGANCFSVGGCIYSPNFPGDYNNAANCTWEIEFFGTLSSPAFNTQPGADTLTLRARTSGGAPGSQTTVTTSYSAIQGPDRVSVLVGNSLSFTSDRRITRSGFEVCFDQLASGGGLFIGSGKVSLVNTTVLGNSATQYGGAIYAKGGSLALVGADVVENTAAAGSGVYFNSGAMAAVGLTFSGTLAGSSAPGASCDSPCAAGNYGECDVASAAAPNCFVNCRCLECPAGRASSAEAATSVETCVSCGAGQVSAAGATACASCPTGKYASSNVSDTGGGLEVQVSVGAVICQACPPGYFASGEASIVCQACGAGTASPGANSICITCGIGEYSPAAAPACLNCSAGFFAAVAKSGACTACPAGAHAASPGSAACAACAKGRAQGATGQAECVDCLPGLSAPRPASAACEDCPGDEFSTRGAASCELCNKGFFRDTSAGACEPCVDGIVCDTDGAATLETMALRANYWRIHPLSTEIHACPLPKACGGTGGVESRRLKTTHDPYCREGYQGVLCAVCAPDFYFNADKRGCTSCEGEGGDAQRATNSNTMKLVMGVFFLALVLAASFQIWGRLSSNQEPTGNSRRLKDLLGSYERQSGKARIDRGGSRTFERKDTSGGRQDKETTTQVIPTGFATVTKIAKTVTTISSVETTTVTRIKPSTKLGAFVQAAKKAQTKLKALVSFGQITANIGFNCNMSFPGMFEQILHGLSFLNLDLVPSLGLHCNFPNFDYVGKMVVVTVAPIVLAVLLGVAYLAVLLKSKTNEKVAADRYSLPEDLARDFTTSELSGLRKLFAKLDVPRDGTVGREKLRKGALELYPDLASEEVDAKVAEALQGLTEEELKGGLGFAEFAAAMCRSRHADPGTRPCAFVSLMDEMAATLKETHGQSVINAFLLLTYLVLVNTSTALFHFLKASFVPLMESSRTAFYFVLRSIVFAPPQ